MTTDWSQNLAQVFASTGQAILAYLPGVLAGLLLLAIGWLAARLLRGLTVRLVRLGGRAAARLARRGEGVPGRLTERSEQLFGSLVFWVVMLVFLTASTHLMGLTLFTDWLAQVTSYLPTLLAGAVIVAAGLMAGALARELVAATAPAPAAQRQLLGRIAQWLIVAVALVTGADQIGIDVTFLMVLAAVVAATLLGGLALALSLGARTYVSNLIAVRNLRPLYRVGQWVRVGEQNGRILEITGTAVILETAEGRVSVPARLFDEQPALLRTQEPGDG